MRPTTKWLVISLGAGFLITALLLNVSINMSNPSHAVALADVVLWPVLVCEKLSVHHGLPPNPGTPEKPLYEGTPVFFFAFAVGLGLSWAFYSTVVFLILWLWRWRRPSV